jgi:hypothetical protein
MGAMQQHHDVGIAIRAVTVTGPTAEENRAGQIVAARYLLHEDTHCALRFEVDICM